MNKIVLDMARGLRKAPLVLKNATIINVFTETLQKGDVAIYEDTIIGIGNYNGEIEIDCSGKYVSPGFIDGHIHIESSMLKPMEFCKSVVPHGTTSVITDPHEIANVSGTDGIEYMLHASKDLPMDTYFMLPSCVPATSFDTSGAVLLANDIEHLYSNPRVLGLAELMNYVGTISGNEDIQDKVHGAMKHNKVIDGHAPNLVGHDLCAYVAAGVMSDHECSNIEEAMNKLSLGQWIMIREGTAARNLEALLPLFQAPYHQRAMLVTDDKHPHDLIEDGHIDYIIRKAISLGADPCIAIKMASFNTATYFGIQKTGAIAPSYKADLVILSSLEDVKVDSVIKSGKLVYQENELIPIEEADVPEELTRKVMNSFHCNELKIEDFIIQDEVKSHMRVIQLVKNEILTEELLVDLKGIAPSVNIQEDILKLAVIERHHNTGKIGLGFVHGYGLKEGAIASSVSHDSHNLIVIGTNDEDMMIASNHLRTLGGGIVVVNKAKILGEIPLPIGGLMSNLDTYELAELISQTKEYAIELGVVDGIDPFMTLAFISLPVIPALRLTTHGLVDSSNYQYVPLMFDL